ncbi:transcription factor iiia [Ephemerocybe angulata]|uniref:Transcription factor iiia n=1 Tax=Ephemerocybe angulata TaxID=980116 RepID=A0A8H6MBU7_9AGAR|nr:transcription factor iiia [Tulosesus angulatus]
MESSLTLTTTVLGKRARSKSHVGVIHLASGSEPSYSEQSDFEPPKPSSSSRPVLINGKLVANTKRRYQCTHPGCDKAYTKPSRLEEHERAHTGERPFVCETCQKTYLRETHLQAHVRSHQPESSRPLACEYKDCQKRFWTSQHLKVHQDWHKGAKPFACTEEGCDEAFSKHNHLRAHICDAHAPPGTKPCRCDHEGCEKSFDTNQHLKTHKKTHNTKRYTCVQGTCLVQSGDEPKYFPTWTALQHHIRTAHPPSCNHPSCNGRVFASHKGLRSHQKLHDQRDDDTDDRPAKKPRRGGDLGRDWKCEFEDCDKDFKSKKALTTHQNVTHMGKRDFVCSDCNKAFGYKHLLQRHTAKIHSVPSDGHDESEHSGKDREASESSDDEEEEDFTQQIDLITGKAYADQSKAKLERAAAFSCPFPDLEGLNENGASSGGSSPKRRKCDYAFSRLYDLRRHLQAVHEVDVTKERLQAWMDGRSTKA